LPETVVVGVAFLVVFIGCLLSAADLPGI